MEKYLYKYKDAQMMEMDVVWMTEFGWLDIIIIIIITNYALK